MEDQTNITAVSLSCSKCGEVKPADRFKKDSRRQFICRGGKHTTCKDCENKLARNRYEVLSDEDPRILEGRRICTACKVNKPLVHFGKCHDFFMGRTANCKACIAKKQKARRHAAGISKTELKRTALTQPDHTRKRKWKLDADGFRAFYDAQDGKCGICRADLPFYGRETCIDHDHVTGVRRELLCRPCNLGLGFMRDNTDTLRAAIAYLEKHSAKEPEKKTA